MKKCIAARTLKCTFLAFFFGSFFLSTASAQDATFDNVMADRLTVLGRSDVFGDQDVEGRLYVEGESCFDSRVDINGDLEITGAVELDGNFEVLGEDVSIDADLVSISGFFVMDISADDMYLSGQLHQSGDSFFKHGQVAIGNLPATANELLYVGSKELPVSPGAVNTGFIEPRIVVENQSTPVEIREMFSLINNGGSLFSFEDTNLGTQWFFSSNSIGDFNISLSGSGGSEVSVRKDGRIILGPGGTKNFDLRPNGNLHIKGTLFQSSDRNLKEEFREVKPETVLSKIDQLPVTTWQFKANQAGNRHMGPTAQDFYAAFGLGQDEKTIAPVDGVGVSLAGIKALSSQVKQKDAQIAELSQELKSQKDLIQNQQQLLEQLAKRLSALESESRPQVVALTSSAVTTN